MSCLFIRIDHNAKNVRIITVAHYRAHTAPIFKHLHFLKLVNLYQLQVNKYVLSFLKDLLPSTLKHIFARSQYQALDSIQINGVKAACQIITQMDPQN